ncbi:hypothetical protein [Leptospirillum ferriphilum]|uniref:Putative transcriptional regulator (AbrB) n=1 Tax=Leptospirillum ferriphilum (strain ML-04) TaxID=1048260 RepID=J9ZCW5_LEPFM|nr:hypothetical protein [Leptospirillum ferriphilum]AFS54006.1 putative transcriptional regulator (AbrB) [Leptospirillum ferriphilum ML-04]
MMTVIVSPKFRAVIPKKIRKDFSLVSAQKRQVPGDKGRIAFILLRNPRKMCGMLKGIETSVPRDNDRL